MHHGLRRPIFVILENPTAVMPPSDTGVGLPWSRLRTLGLTHFKVTNHSTPHGLGNIFDIEDRFQLAAVTPHVGVVIVGHDWRGQLRDTEPYFQFSAAWGPGVEIPVTVIVEIEEIRIVS